LIEFSTNKNISTEADEEETTKYRKSKKVNNI
jgi:hypothetical protein